jgi:hypothetical protein
LPIQKKIVSLFYNSKVIFLNKIFFKQSIMTKTNQGTAAAQEAAAPTTTSTVNAATVATKRKMPLKKVKAEKTEKMPKRVVGVLVHVATTSYNYWRNAVNEILNGTDATTPRIARFVKDESAKGTKWGGFIAIAPENVEAIVAKMAAWSTANSAKPMVTAADTVTDENYEQFQSEQPWAMLEHFQTVEPKPRVRKSKEEANIETTEIVETTETAPAETEVTA